MSKSEMKPREFWIHSGKNSIRKIKPHEQVEDYDNFIHVIEHSAYVAALELIERLEETFKCIDLDYEAYWGMSSEALADIKKFREGL